VVAPSGAVPEPFKKEKTDKPFGGWTKRQKGKRTEKGDVGGGNPILHYKGEGRALNLFTDPKRGKRHDQVEKPGIAQRWTGTNEAEGAEKKERDAGMYGAREV